MKQSIGMWKVLKDDDQLNFLITESLNYPQVIFKHSTRCATSQLAKSRLERKFPGDNISFHLLDLIRHRSISDKVSKIFDVYHESPQVLLIKNGKCIYDESHLGISMDEIMEQAGN